MQVLKTGMVALVMVMAPMSVQHASAQTAAPAAKPKPATAKPSKSRTSTRTAATRSPCKGLNSSACGAKSGCTWVKPKKKVDVRGRKLTAYCRKVAKPK